MMTNPSSVTVRLIQAGDEKAIAEIWVNGLSQTAEANSFLLRPILRPKMEQLGKDALSETGDMGREGNKLLEKWRRPSRAMFVACNDDEYSQRIVGVIGVKKGADSDEDEADASVASIWKMSVDISARRQRVGQALLKVAEEYARENLQCHTIVLMTANPAAGDFYESSGFVRVPPATWYEAFHPISFILRRYRKDL